MAMFIIGAAGFILISFLSFFVPTVYTRGWGYANISGIGKGYAEGSDNYYTIINITGAIGIVMIVLVLIVMILYTALLIAKKSAMIPRVIVCLTGLLPAAEMIACSSMLAADARFQKIGTGIVVGAGTHSGLTGFGWLVIFGTIICFILVCVGLTKFNNSIKNNKSTKKVVVKNSNSKTKISDDDFSI